MGFFERFGFGGGNVEKSKELDKPKEAEKPRIDSKLEAPVSKRLSTEIELAPQEILEADEGVREIALYQVKYGKIIQEKGGPILKGSEHTITGHTIDCPREIFTISHPNYFHLGRDLGTVNESGPQYPWKDEVGGISRFTTLLNGIPYVICAKAGYRNEDGEGSSYGRKYTEGKLIAIPATQWSVSLIPQLAELLKIEPTISGEPQILGMEIVTTEKLDEPLPDGWLDESIKELMIHTIAGAPFGLQDWNISESDFLNRIFYVLICLPESISRQVSFGTGLYKATDDLRITHGMSALTKPRKIAGNWIDDDEKRHQLGKEYIEYLLPKLSEAKT